MPKSAIGIMAGVILLAAAIFASNAKASALTGAISVQPVTNYSFVEKAGCGANEKDVKCEQGMMLACPKGTTPQSPDCKCDTCPPEGMHGCPCGPGRSCNYLGRWIHCP